MKKIVFLLLIFTSLLNLSWADDELTKGEIDPSVKVDLYGYFEVSFLNNKANPSDCYRATPGTLSQELSIKLCRGALSNAPADCYKATPGTLSMELSVELCVKAVSTAPSECYKATPGSLSQELSVKLCARATSNEPVVCYKNTGNLSAELSVDLCAASNNFGHCDL